MTPGHAKLAVATTLAIVALGLALGALLRHLTL